MRTAVNKVATAGESGELVVYNKVNKYLRYYTIKLCTPMGYCRRYPAC